MALRFMEERIDFAAAFRWAARLGWQTGICNHFSWMVDDQHILINPRGLFWSEITASNLVLLDGTTTSLKVAMRSRKRLFLFMCPHIV